MATRSGTPYVQFADRTQRREEQPTIERRPTQASGEVLDTDYVMVLRVDDGVVTHGVDLIDADAQADFGRLRVDGQDA